MPNTRMTREKFKLHFQYYRVIYVLIIIVAIMAGSLTFTMTKYHAPNARRVDIELIGLYANTNSENAKALKARLLEAGQEAERQADRERGVDVEAQDYEPQLQEVDIMNVSYDANGSSDDAYYALQKYMVTLAAQEGDIYVLSRTEMIDLINQNTLVPLDDYIERGVIDPGDRDLAKVTFDEMDDEGKGTGEQHVYGLQAAGMSGFANELTFDPSEKYMVIMQFSQNQDTAAAVMNALMKELAAPEEPEEAAETEETPADEADEAAGTEEAPADEADEAAGTEEAPADEADKAVETAEETPSDEADAAEGDAE